LVYWEEETATANEAYDLWKQVDASKDMILNKGKWTFRVWKAMGVGIKNGYAVIWLGDKPDKTADIHICGMDTLIQSKENSIVPLDIKPTPKGQKKDTIETVKWKKDKIEGKKVVATKEVAFDSTSVENSVPKENHFFIIVASLKTEKLAKEKINELISQGYKDAVMLPAADRFRVSLGSYRNERLTKERMKELKVTFPDCWLFRK